MNRKFLVDRYLAENSDVANVNSEEAFAVSPADHYRQYGEAELRGYEDVGSTYNIETVALCLDGHVFMTGWINRRLHQDFELAVRVGYEEFVVPKDAFAFYKREDISNHLNEPSLRGAFVCLFATDTPIRANTVSFRLARHELTPSVPAHPKSNEAFLEEVLKQLAFLTSHPQSTTHGAGQFLSAALAPTWRSYLNQIKFTEVFTSRQLSKVTPQVSFVTVIYKETSLLKPQILLMAEAMKRTDLEWLIIINKCSNVESVLRDVAALDQLVPYSLRVVVASNNSGFSHANNYGASIARSSRVALVNPDIFPTPGLEQQLGALLDVSLPQGTLLGAQMNYGSGSLMHDGMNIAEDPTFDEETGTALSLLRVEHFGKDSALPARDLKPHVRNVPAVSGAFWLIQQETLFKFGGLSTDYLFAHYEDADFCLRVWEQGGRVRVFGPAVLTHHEGVGSHSSPIGLSTRWLNRCTFSERWRNKYKAIVPQAVGADLANSEAA
jgi:GT2 family glycosyltransferase